MMQGVEDMTGIERIKNRILQDAKAEAEEYVNKALEKADKIMEVSRQEACERSKALLDQAEKKAAETKNRSLALNDMEVRKEKLGVKQELVKRVFDMAVERLCSMPAEQYCEFLANMIVGAAGEEKADIILSKEDRAAFGETVLIRTATLAKARGLQMEVELSDHTVDIKGGFILRTKHMEINYSFEALLRAGKEELEEIAYSMLGIR